MKLELIGVQYRNYVSKKSGKNVSGANLFLARTDSSVRGKRSDVFWFSCNQNEAAKLQLGPVDVQFDMYGHIESLESVK